MIEIKWVLSAVGALAVFLIAFVHKRPRVCQRIAKFVDSIALVCGFVFLGCLAGALTARFSFINNVTSIYGAESFAIGTDDPNEGGGGAWMLERIAASVDPFIRHYLVFVGICLLVVVICRTATAISQMVMDDDATSRPTAQSPQGEIALSAKAPDLPQLN